MSTVAVTVSAANGRMAALSESFIPTMQLYSLVVKFKNSGCQVVKSGACDDAMRVFSSTLLFVKHRCCAYLSEPLQDLVMTHDVVNVFAVDIQNVSAHSYVKNNTVF